MGIPDRSSGAIIGRLLLGAGRWVRGRFGLVGDDDDVFSLAVDEDVGAECGLDKRKNMSPDVRSYSASLYVRCTVSKSALNRTDFFMVGKDVVSCT